MYDCFIVSAELSRRPFEITEHLKVKLNAVQSKVGCFKKKRNPKTLNKDVPGVYLSQSVGVGILSFSVFDLLPFLEARLSNACTLLIDCSPGPTFADPPVRIRKRCLLVLHVSHCSVRHLS